MSNREKITVKARWIVAQNSWHTAEIVGATYRQALTYANSIRRLGCDHVLPKPQIEG
jgi:hypothetical protein